MMGRRGAVKAQYGEKIRVCANQENNYLSIDAVEYRA